MHIFLKTPKSFDFLAFPLPQNHRFHMGSQSKYGTIFYDFNNFFQSSVNPIDFLLVNI